MLNEKTINFLKTSKNILAFSAGVDSSALFFLLLEQNVDFDIAIVNYNTRESSKREVEYAQEIAEKYKKSIYTSSCKLPDSNFENLARQHRYKFFEKIIMQNNYNSLITAHQLNDKVEWALMRFCNGSGISGIVGMNEIGERKNYNIVRPLLNISRIEIEKYLFDNSIKHFLDESNSNEKYLRNYFRKEYANSLTRDYSDGIRRSFEILSNEKNCLYENAQLFEYKNIFVSQPKNSMDKLFQLEKILKETGYVLSQLQRDEFVKTSDIVISGKYSAVFDGNKLFISPYVKLTMSKEFKESCRKNKIPPKIRGYLFQNNIDPLMLRSRINLFFA